MSSIEKGRNRKKIVEMLAEAGARPNEMNSAGQTPLMQAAVCGDDSYARVLLAVGAHPNLVNDRNETALSFAVVWRQAEFASLLLRNGAKPDNPIRPWTPLMYAAQEGDVRIARLLLRAGARPNRADPYGRTAWDIAKAGGRRAFLTALEAKLRPPRRRS